MPVQKVSGSFALPTREIAGCRPVTVCLFAGILAFGPPGGGVVRSGDDGKSWTAVNEGLTYAEGYAFPVFDLVSDTRGRLFAGTSGVYRSTDDGEHWEAISNGLPRDENGFVAVWTLAISGH